MASAAAEHGVPEAARRGLVDGGDVGEGRELADGGEQVGLAAGGELGLEGRRRREVGGGEGVAGVGDEDDAADAGAGGLLDAILDDGAVDEGQQLLGERPGGGQHAGAEPGRRHEKVVDGAARRHAGRIVSEGRMTGLEWRTDA